VRGGLLFVVLVLCALCPALPARAEEPAESMPSLSEMSSLVERIDGESPKTLATPIKVLLLLTLLSFAPAMLILTTSFTRIVIVLALIRRALTTRNVPPSQVVVGLALFLSLFVMAPTLKQMNAQAIRPYLSGSIGAQEALSRGVVPLRDFMLSQTSREDLALFVRMSDIEQPETAEDVPTYVVIPAFVISELKKAFELGFVLFLPFLVVDLITASVLLSMGMMMLPPTMISAPLKLLLFVLVDGWHLVTESLMLSFGGAGG